MSTDTGVKFTRQQVEYINRMFPEVTGSATTSDAELRFRAGQRSVVLILSSKIADESREIK